MRVGLEVRALHRSYRGSGQSRYAYNLLRELAGQDRENEYQLFAPYPRDERFRTSAEYAACCRRVAEALARAMGDEA